MSNEEIEEIENKIADIQREHAEKLAALQKEFDYKRDLLRHEKLDAIALLRKLENANHG